jgi:phage tail-like protein
MMSAIKDPYAGFRFTVEIDGLATTGFCEVSGLSSEVDVITYREAGDFAVRKIPGVHKVGDIVLKRGITGSCELQLWHQSIAAGNFDKRNGAVTLRDGAGNAVARWKFRGAFPRKWEGPSLDAHGVEVAIETLTLACEGLEREC